MEKSAKFIIDVSAETKRCFSRTQRSRRPQATLSSKDLTLTLTLGNTSRRCLLHSISNCQSSQPI